jgi:hypothetical protein
VPRPLVLSMAVAQPDPPVEVYGHLWYRVSVRYRIPVGVRLFFATALLAVAFAPVAQSERQTTTPSVYVVIHVTLTDSKVVVSPKEAPRGASARFIMRNVGTKPITFNVGKQTPGLGDLFGFRSVIKPRTQKILLLYLSDRGAIPYYTGDSFASAKPTAKGTLLVGTACALCAPPGPPPPP